MMKGKGRIKLRMANVFEYLRRDCKQGDKIEEDE